MKILALFIASTVMSASAFALDGSAEFRVLGGGLVGFQYDADMEGGHIQGEVWSDGTDLIRLDQDRSGGWTGRLGSVTVSVAPARRLATGEEAIEVRSIRGIYDYMAKVAPNGDLELSGMSPRGNLLGASLENDGTDFSVGIGSLSVGLSESTEGDYEGFISSWGGSESASLNVSGSLSLRAVAKSDRALFALLFVLPFELGR